MIGFFTMIILGIETSCDETSVALVNDQRQILAMSTWSQIAEHEPFGGVVPEIAARAHVDKIIPMIDQTIKKAFANTDIAPIKDSPSALATKDDKKAINPLAPIDAIAATLGPGLIGGLMVGAITAKALALSLQKPFLAINHLEAHALSARLAFPQLHFPYLLLLVSGGHCQLVAALGVGHYEIYGETLDDAAGEVFDKGARLLGLPQPGGPAIERAAQQGQADMFPLPTPLKGKKTYDFSFSGLKTALKNSLNTQTESGQQPPRITHHAAAALQKAIGESLVERTALAMERFRRERQESSQHNDHHHPLPFCLVGGVAANHYIRRQMEQLCQQQGYELFAPPPALCTDNGAMIAWAGMERLTHGQQDSLSARARPRWPLDETSLGQTI